MAKNLAEDAPKPPTDNPYAEPQSVSRTARDDEFPVRTVVAQAFVYILAHLIPPGLFALGLGLIGHASWLRIGIMTAWVTLGACFHFYVHRSQRRRRVGRRLGAVLVRMAIVIGVQFPCFWILLDPLPIPREFFGW